MTTVGSSLCALVPLQINGVVDGGLSCDALGLVELRNKLTAHKVMQLSVKSMEEYAKSNSTCTN